MRDINNMVRCEMEEEIKTLRARIVELEGYKDAWLHVARCRDTAERELAALKAEMKLEAEGPDWIQRAMQAEAKLEVMSWERGEPGLTALGKD